MNGFSNEEKTDMILVYGQCRKNSVVSAQTYLEKYPDRRQPNRTLFKKLDTLLRKRGSFQIRKQENTHKFRISGQDEEFLLAYVEINPLSSLQEIAMECSMTYSTVYRCMSIVY